ncbi:unnamed protein product, partial [Staurois parvus]
MVGMDLMQPETRSRPPELPQLSWWELDGNTCSVVRQAGSITMEQTVVDGKQRILRSRARFINGRSGKGFKAANSLVQAETVTRRATRTEQELATRKHTG